MTTAPILPSKTTPGELHLEAHCALSPFAGLASRRLVGPAGEDIIEIFDRLVEDDLLVVLRDYGPLLNTLDLGIRAVGVDLQSVPQRLRLLTGLGHKVELDCHVELAPAGLVHLEGRLLDG